MATKRRVEYTPEKDYVYTEKTATSKPWGTYQTPEERAAANKAAIEAANSPAAQAAANKAAATIPNVTGWAAYKTPEERTAIAKAASTSEPLNPNPLGDVDPIYQNAAGTASGAGAYQAAVEQASKELVSQDLLNEYLNRGKFSYNEAADPLWQQYRRKYLEAGNKAMKDTLGKATALTGGYDNSYANIAAQQVNNEYAAKAADKIPELYQLALDRYNQEGQDILNRYELLYGREKDQAEADFQREKFAYQQSRDAVADQQWAQEFGLKANAQEWSQYMDERQMTLNEAKFFLEQEIERGNLDIKKAQLALQQFETEQSVAQGWTKIANDYSLNSRELDMRENGTYFDQSSGGKTTTDAAEAAALGTTEAELAAYKAKFTGSVKLDTDDKWSSALNKVVADLKRGTFDESSLYKYTYDQAMALFDRAEAMAKNSVKPKNTVSQGTR